MNIARNLLNKTGANKKYIFAKVGSKLIVTVSLYNDFFIVYNSVRNEAKKYRYVNDAKEKREEEINRLIEKIKLNNFVLMEAYVYN